MLSSNIARTSLYARRQLVAQLHLTSSAMADFTENLREVCRRPEPPSVCLPAFLRTEPSSSAVCATFVLPQWFVRKLFRPLLQRVRDLDAELAQVNLGHLSCATTTFDSPPTMPVNPTPAPAASGGLGGGTGAFGFGGSFASSAYQRVPTTLQEWQQLGTQVPVSLRFVAQPVRSQLAHLGTSYDLGGVHGRCGSVGQPALLVRRLRLETYLTVGRPAAPRDYVLGRLTGKLDFLDTRRWNMGRATVPPHSNPPPPPPRPTPTPTQPPPHTDSYLVSIRSAQSWRKTDASSAMPGTAVASTRARRGRRTIPRTLRYYVVTF